MKFLSYNIQYGKGQDGESNLYRVAETIKEADVVCIQEIGEILATLRFCRPSTDIV